MRLLIGCPVARRAWILPTWFRYVEEASKAADVDPEFVFLIDREDPSVEVIVEEAPGEVHWIWHTEGENGRTWELEGGRTWNPDRYHYMVDIRNQLLGRVRKLSPQFFFSLDSDILLDPRAIKQLIEDADQYDAVGAKCYMTTTGKQFPSYAMFNGPALMRRDMDCGPTPVDMIMAAKLMTPKAYEIDYLFDVQGEDAGWSRNCKANAVTLGWEGRIVNKHVMTESWLNRVDRRCGW